MPYSPAPRYLSTYLCAGRPTVLAIDKSNAAAQTIRKAGAGYVVPSGHTESFVETVQMLVNDHDLRLAHGRSARAYAESTFGIENILARFMEILQRVDPALTFPVPAESAIAS